jgi:hypothetical protein
MADSTGQTGTGLSVEEELRREFHSQTAKISWQELQPHYARGAVVLVAPGQDLVDVAVQLRQDNTERFEQWLAAGDVSRIEDDQARELLEENPVVWAVVVAPWVLVQRGRD